jgi:hypothetical protein
MDARDSLRALIPAELKNRVHVHARVGPVVRVILDYARLIIMGITRKNILRNLFLKASANGVQRGRPCPVWIVPGSGSSADCVVADDLEFFGFPAPCQS